MGHIAKADLYRWCSIPADQLQGNSQLRAKFRMVADSAAMGNLMAQELVQEIEANNGKDAATRAIIPCGPSCWYGPFTDLVNRRHTSLKNLFVFHMDECLDWQARPLPPGHPYNFRTFMEKHFYGGISPELAVPQEQRFWLLPSTMDRVAVEIMKAPLDITIGGWGQDGHIAYNQARRHPSARSLWTNWPAPVFASRKTMWTPSWRWHSVPSEAPTSLCRPCPSHSA